MTGTVNNTAVDVLVDNAVITPPSPSSTPIPLWDVDGVNNSVSVAISDGVTFASNGGIRKWKDGQWTADQTGTPARDDCTPR